MSRSFARILLFTFGISISLYTLLETGHEILHHVQNNLHHHDIDENDHHHNLADHHLTGHPDDHDAMDEGSLGLGLMTLSLGMSAPHQQAFTSSVTDANDYATTFVCVYHSITLAPPTPPPLG